MDQDNVSKTNECHEAILMTLSHIPHGKVCSYGQVAELSGAPGKARYVAYILKTLPNHSEIPWHRVINSQGKISFPEDSSKYDEQKYKLLAEGVPVPLNKKEYKKYAWQGD